MIRSHWWTLVAVLALALSPALRGAHAGEAPTPPAGSAPPVQHKQYGHFILDNVRINAMGVTCTIKRIRFLYKGDGLDNEVAKCALTNGESEKKAEVSKVLTEVLEKLEKTEGAKTPSCSCFPACPGSLGCGVLTTSCGTCIGSSPCWCVPATKIEKAELKKADGSDSKIEKGTAKPE